MWPSCKVTGGCFRLLCAHSPTHIHTNKYTLDLDRCQDGIQPSHSLHTTAHMLSHLFSAKCICLMASWVISSWLTSQRPHVERTLIRARQATAAQQSVTLAFTNMWKHSCTFTSGRWWWPLTSAQPQKLDGWIGNKRRLSCELSSSWWLWDDCVEHHYADVSNLVSSQWLGTPLCLQSLWRVHVIILFRT